jgi:hypothetical protein
LGKASRVSWFNWCLVAVFSIDGVAAILMGFLAMLGSLVLVIASELGTAQQFESAALTGRERRRQHSARVALGFSLLGIVVCIAGLFLLKVAFLYGAAVLFVLALGSRIAGLLDLRVGSWFSRWLHWPRTRWGWIGWGCLSLFLILACLFALPLLPNAGQQRSEAKKGPYVVSGTTCGDGSCTLNECGEPSPCGLHNIGRLHAEQGISIECQVMGGKVTTPDGHHLSYIWDRLAPHVYVSDLFIEGTEVNRFSPKLARCPRENRMAR